MHLIQIRDADLGNAFDPVWDAILGMHLIRIRDADLGNASDPDPG
jgi:hypothetical protein